MSFRKTTLPSEKLSKIINNNSRIMILIYLLVMIESIQNPCIKRESHTLQRHDYIKLHFPSYKD